MADSHSRLAVVLAAGIRPAGIGLVAAGGTHATLAPSFTFLPSSVFILAGGPIVEAAAAIAGAAVIALLRFRVGVMPLIAGCAVAGLAVHFAFAP